MRFVRTSIRRVLSILAILAFAGGAAAHGYKLGDLEIGHPYSRATAGKTGVGYLSVTNNGGAPDRLLRATVGTGVADRAELHMTIRDGDVMRMRPVGAVDIAPGQTVRLEPGGLHVMLAGLKAPLKAGDKVPLTLVFERAGSVEVVLNVDKAGAEGHTGH